MKSKLMYSLILAALAAAFGAGYSIKKVQTVYVDVPKTVTDTLYVQLPPVHVPHLPAVHDTIWQDLIIAVHDTLYAPLEVARTETVLEAEGVRYGRLDVAYYFPPADWFDLDFDPAPLPTVTVTKYVEVRRKWYANPYLTAAAGIIAGVALSNN